MGPTHLHGALPGGRARCWDSHPSSPTHHSSRWCQPLYRLKTSEMERCERVYLVDGRCERVFLVVRKQGAGLWTQFRTLYSRSLLLPRERAGCVPLLRGDPPHTGLPGWVLCEAGCWPTHVRGCWMFQSWQVHTTHLGSSTRQPKTPLVWKASEVAGCQPWNLAGRESTESKHCISIAVASNTNEKK